MLPQPLSRVVAAFLTLLSTGGVAEAHPHVWVDTIVTALFDHGQVTALREEWWFDEEFTVEALSEVRKTKGMAAAVPKPLTQVEVVQLQEKAFSNLANYSYFTHVWSGGKVIGLGKQVSSFLARMDGAKLAYSFTLPLAVPLDPRAASLRVGVWDDTYYVDVGPAQGQAARVEGDGSAGCKARVIDDKDHKIYFGSVIPKVVEITC